MRSLALLALCACGKGSEPAPAPPSAPAAGSGSAVATAPAPPPADAAAALSPKIAAARCGEPCLFLVDTPIANLVDEYRAKCAGMATHELGFDDCKQLDYVRNCIYAAHGVTYKKKKWKQVFAAKPWYEPRDDIDTKHVLSALELANVHELHQRGKACRNNANISGADYERVTAWLRALPAPPLPPLVVWDGEATTGAELVKQLKHDLDEQGMAAKLEPKHAVTAYIDQLDGEGAAEEMPPALRDKLLQMKPVPRVVQVNFISDTTGTEDNPLMEGTHLWLAYDAHDQLVAAGGAHFLYD